MHRYQLVDFVQDSRTQTITDDETLAPIPCDEFLPVNHVYNLLGYANAIWHEFRFDLERIFQ